MTVALQEDRQLMHNTSFSERAPACDPAGHACGEDVGGRRQADGLDGVAEFQRLAELQQSNVVVKGHGVVIRVGDDPLQQASLHVVELVLVLHAAVSLPAVWDVVPGTRRGCRG